MPCLPQKPEKYFSSWLLFWGFVSVLTQKGQKALSSLLLGLNPHLLLKCPNTHSQKLASIPQKKNCTCNTQMQFLETCDVAIPLISEARLRRAAEAGQHKGQALLPLASLKRGRGCPLGHTGGCSCSRTVNKRWKLTQVKNKEPSRKASIPLPLAIIFNPNQLLELTHSVTLQAVVSAQLRNEGTKQVQRAAKIP